MTKKTTNQNNVKLDTVGLTIGLMMIEGLDMTVMDVMDVDITVMVIGDATIETGITGHTATIGTDVEVVIMVIGHITVVEIVETTEVVIMVIVGGMMIETDISAEIEVMVTITIDLTGVLTEKDHNQDVVGLRRKRISSRTLLLIINHLRKNRGLQLLRKWVSLSTSVTISTFR